MAELPEDVKDQFAAIVNVEFAEQPIQMRAHGRQRDAQLLSDLLVSQAVKKVPDNFRLPRRERQIANQLAPFAMGKDIAPS